jgi:phage terminase large subunit-like protein
LIAAEDGAGNLKPDKKHSTERIDGMVALIMGLDRAVRHGGGQSIYEEQELRFL